MRDWNQRNWLGAAIEILPSCSTARDENSIATEGRVLEGERVKSVAFEAVDRLDSTAWSEHEHATDDLAWQVLHR